MSDRSYNVGRYGTVELLTLAPRRDATHTTARSGSWDDPSTWVDEEVPGDGARVHVGDDVTVTLSHQDDSRLETVRVDGTLRFDPSADTKLRVDTLLVSKTGRIEIGTASDPVDAGVTAELEFLEEIPIQRPDDPLHVGRGLIVLGECEIHGAPKTTWDVLDGHARAGDPSIRLDGSGPAALSNDGWREGDEIVFPDQEPWGGVPEEVADDGVSPTATRDDEIRTITAVSGDSISLDDSLDVDHVPPESGLDSYVLNLSRNVKLYSESDAESEYGHVMFMSTEQSIRFCETKQVGRTDKKIQASNPLWGRGESAQERLSNPRARYAIHFHRTGPTADPHVVQGCSIRDNPGWGVVNHGSAVDMLDNVSYDVDGCAFVTEKGGESGSMKRNFALRSVGSGEEIDSRKGWTNLHPNQMADPPGNIDDFGHHGGGFWIHSPIVEVEENVAAGHRAHGFEFWFRALVERPLDEARLDGKHDMFPVLDASLLTDEELEIGRSGSSEPKIRRGEETWHERDDSKYFNDSLPIRQFDDNVAFGSGAGVEFRSVSFRNRTSRTRWSDLRGFLAYNIGDHYDEDGDRRSQFANFESAGNVGADHRYVGNITNVDFTLLGDGDGIGSSNNHAYTNGWDVVDSEIRGWEYGYVPKRYSNPGYNQVLDTEFENDTDILFKRRFPRGESALYLSGNTYGGDNLLEWEELPPMDMKPQFFVTDVGQVNWEGRNVYHGWCDPDFVLLPEDDDERLDTALNHAEHWEDHLDGADPADVLPGKTHRELYEEYGILFYGGMLDRSDGERQEECVGSGGAYDSTPYFGPATKTQPTDEIWIDAVDEMRVSGTAKTVSYDDGDVVNRDPLQMANDGSAVQLEAAGWKHYELPVEDEEGVAAYDFEVSRSGTYQVFVRSTVGTYDGDPPQYRDIYAHLFYVRIDGGDWVELGGDNGGTISSYDEVVWSRDKPLEFDLDEGQHTIEIAGKGANMRLDWVLICHQTVAAAPIGEGKRHTPRS